MESRVMGNYHARFLEGRGRATVPGYSASLRARRQGVAGEEGAVIL